MKKIIKINESDIHNIVMDVINEIATRPNPLYMIYNQLLKMKLKKINNRLPLGDIDELTPQELQEELGNKGLRYCAQGNTVYFWIIRINNNGSVEPSDSNCVAFCNGQAFDDEDSAIENLNKYKAKIGLTQDNELNDDINRGVFCEVYSCDFIDVNTIKCERLDDGVSDDFWLS